MIYLKFLPENVCQITDVEHCQQQLAPRKLKSMELPPWKAEFMSFVDEASICLTGKALRMVKDLGFTINVNERAQEKTK